MLSAALQSRPSTRRARRSGIAGPGAAASGTRRCHPEANNAGSRAGGSLLAGNECCRVQAIGSAQWVLPRPCDASGGSERSGRRPPLRASSDFSMQDITSECISSQAQCTPDGLLINTGACMFPAVSFRLHLRLQPLTRRRRASPRGAAPARSRGASGAGLQAGGSCKGLGFQGLWQVRAALRSPDHLYVRNPIRRVLPLDRQSRSTLNLTLVGPLLLIRILGPQGADRFGDGLPRACDRARGAGARAPASRGLEAGEHPLCRTAGITAGIRAARVLPLSLPTLPSTLSPPWGYLS